MSDTVFSKQYSWQIINTAKDLGNNQILGKKYTAVEKDIELTHFHQLEPPAVHTTDCPIRIIQCNCPISPSGTVMHVPPQVQSHLTATYTNSVPIVNMLKTFFVCTVSRLNTMFQF